MQYLIKANNLETLFVLLNAAWCGRDAWLKSGKKKVEFKVQIVAGESKKDKRKKHPYFVLRSLFTSVELDFPVDAKGASLMCSRWATLRVLLTMLHNAFSWEDK